MLLFKNDYVIIDCEHSELAKDYHNLLFYVTIQVNGKLRRTRFSTRVVKEENHNSSNSVNGWDLDNYDSLYNPMRMINQLGYNVPVDVELHPLLNDALEYFFGRQVPSKDVGEGTVIQELHGVDSI